MATKIDIANQALALLGESPITGFSEDSSVARLANLTFDNYRDSVIRDHLWNFAMRRDSLTAEATAPKWGFARSYPLPSDLLRFVSINDTSRSPFRIENQRVLSDLESPIEILYVARVTNTESYDALFVDALSTYLAWRWSERLSGTSSLVESLRTEYSAIVQNARSMDGQEGPPAVLEACEWVDARFS